MAETKTIEVEKVYGPRQAGKGQVYDVRLVGDDEKWNAWGSIGEDLQKEGPGKYAVSYELRPRQGYNNPTILAVIGKDSDYQPSNVVSINNGSGTANPTNTDPKQQEIRKAVALKAAVELGPDATLEDLTNVLSTADSILLWMAGDFFQIGEES